LEHVPEARKEVAAFTNICGVPCRGKADYISNDGYLVDIKTAASIKLRTFMDITGEEKTYWPPMFDYGYDVQACWYLLLFSKLQLKGFRFAVIEKKAPFDYMTFEVELDILIRAKQKIKSGLERYKSCVANKEWPGYTKDIQKISLPPYLKED